RAGTVGTPPRPRGERRAGPRAALPLPDRLGTLREGLCHAREVIARDAACGRLGAARNAGLGRGQADAHGQGIPSGVPAAPSRAVCPTRTAGISPCCGACEPLSGDASSEKNLSTVPARDDGLLPAASVTTGYGNGCTRPCSHGRQGQ